MAIAFQGARAVLSVHCPPEEAETLLEWLRQTPDAEIDMRPCQSVHAAVLQVLLAARPLLAGPPAERFLAGCLAHLPPAPEEPPPPPVVAEKAKARPGAKRKRTAAAAGLAAP